MKNTKKTGYSEPSSYFPKEVRKKAKIGEYATEKADKKKVKRTKKK